MLQYTNFKTTTVSKIFSYNQVTAFNNIAKQKLEENCEMCLNFQSTNLEKNHLTAVTVRRKRVVYNHGYG